MLFVSATPFSVLANPQLDSAADVSRVLKAGRFAPLYLRLFRSLISVFDNSDPGLHD
jgi:hypothetical protein